METVSCDCSASQARLFHDGAISWERGQNKPLTCAASNSSESLLQSGDARAYRMSVICVDSDEWDVGHKPEPCRNTASLAALRNTQICIVQLTGHSAKLGQRDENCEILASCWCLSLLSSIDQSGTGGTLQVQGSGKLTHYRRHKMSRTPMETATNPSELPDHYVVVVAWNNTQEEPWLRKTLKQARSQVQKSCKNSRQRPGLAATTCHQLREVWDYDKLTWLDKQCRDGL